MSMNGTSSRMSRVITWLGKLAIPIPEAMLTNAEGGVRNEDSLCFVVLPDSGRYFSIVHSILTNLL
jgi:hypothetical protein